MLPDFINAMFEFGGALAISASIIKLSRDKEVKGVSWYMIAFFTSWGAWNVFYYPHLGQWASFIAGVLVLTANLMYLGMLLRYTRTVKHIYDREEKRLYLSRYWLLGSEKSYGALMLHHMHVPDEDTCCHDHPWSFITLVLRGGYHEQIEAPDGTRQELRNPPGVIRYRRAEHRHRISRLPAGDCWTLVLRFPKRRHWGFWTKVGWVHWEKFIDDRRNKGVVWCDINPGESK